MLRLVLVFLVAFALGALSLEAVRRSAEQPVAQTALPRCEEVASTKSGSAEPAYRLEALRTLRDDLAGERRRAADLAASNDALREELALLSEACDASALDAGLADADDPQDSENTIVEPTPEDFSEFDAEPLLEVYPEATVTEIREAFEEAEYLILGLEQATFAGETEWDEPGGLQAAIREVWAETKKRLGSDEYAAGLYATGRPNRLAYLGGEDSEAIAEGLNPGDILLSVNSASVHNAEELFEQVAVTSPGANELELVVFRNGGRETIRLTGPLATEAFAEESVSPADYYAEE